MKKFLVKCTFEGEPCLHIAMAENAHAAGEKAWRKHEKDWLGRGCDPGELPFQIDDVEEISRPVFQVEAGLNNDSRTFVFVAGSPEEAIQRAYLALGAKVTSVVEVTEVVEA